MRVTSHHLLSLTPGGILFELSILDKVPLDEGLVTGSREEELDSLAVNLLFSSSEGSDPTTVTY